MLPVVAIVGRPNVGKSTLFNCLTTSRNALISDFPGMTRDRQYGEANIGSRRFIVIDTGGLTEEKDALNKLTAEQSLQAILEADKVIFLVDGREGITASDQFIAEKLRRLEKTFYLVVNKTESLDAELASSEFYRLGFGKPVPISTAHKEGITTLVHTLFPEDIPLEIEKIEKNSIKLAIIGRPNVGKSTLTNRLVGEERVIVSDSPGTTRDSIFIPLERGNSSYTLIDTAGIRRRGKVFEANEKFSVVKTLKAISESHVVLFIMDAHEGVTEQDLKLLGFVLESGRALVIAMNKWDGLTEDVRIVARNSIDRRLNFLPYVRIHYISALHGSGVGDLFQSIDEAYRSATLELSTPELTKILNDAVNAHTPPLVHGRRIKLRYAHPGGHNPPRIIIHGNQVHALPDAYKRYLANTFQERLHLMGTPVHTEFKSGVNPYRHKKNPLTQRQAKKKTRLLRYSKRQR